MRAVEFVSSKQIVESVSTSTMYSVLKDFLPFVMDALNLDKLPKINIRHKIEYSGQPSFGCFKGDSIDLSIDDRHPIDVCRTLAHELVHFKQGLNNKLNDESGETGSQEENEANSIAGIVMRNFNKKFPHYIGGNEDH